MAVTVFACRDRPPESASPSLRRLKDGYFVRPLVGGGSRLHGGTPNDLAMLPNRHLAKGAAGLKLAFQVRHSPAKNDRGCHPPPTQWAHPTKLASFSLSVIVLHGAFFRFAPHSGGR